MNTNEFLRVWGKLNKKMKMYMENELAPDLTESQLHVLEYMLDKEPLKPSDFTEYLHTTPAAITTLLDRMEKGGLIRRKRDEKDRRIVWIHVTEKGKIECARGQTIREKWLDAYLGKISEHNQQLLIYLLSKVAN
ncbi:MAG: transcriptional regulator [Paenibacillus sp. RIFOXYA1_FULL_44_5]|nr:MAG: transcriptional regulator [Paenibacillus sp. RIFOXYA1_FULL_44_5]